jgi:PGF-pre-PGF domain-containing protein
VRTLLLAGLLLALVAAESVSVQYQPNFEANISNGGDFTFFPNRTLWSISVSAGPDARLRYRELTGVSRDAPHMKVYKYVEIAKENAVSDIDIIFAVPKNWLKNENASATDVVIKKRVGGDWVELNRYYEAQDLLRNFYRVRMDTLSTFAIGVRDYEEIVEDTGPEGCAPPTEWSECADGKRTRVVEELVGGNCIPRNEVRDCPVELKTSPNPLVTVVILAMIAMVGLLGFPIVRNKGKPF